MPTPPLALRFSLSGDDIGMGERMCPGAAQLARGEYTVATAWCAAVWETTLGAAGVRSCGALKLVIALQAESGSTSGQSRLAMRRLCERLHAVPSAGTAREAWPLEPCTRRAALHDKARDNAG